RGGRRMLARHGPSPCGCACGLRAGREDHGQNDREAGRAHRGRLARVPARAQILASSLAGAASCARVRRQCPARGSACDGRRWSCVRASSPSRRTSTSRSSVAGACWWRSPPGPPTWVRSPAPALATALRIPKLVLVDPQGGLLAGQLRRLSFVDAHVLDALLRDGEAEWSGLGDRRALLVAVRDALQGSVESVNLCTAEGIAEELFTYVGSGTLFTRDDYCRVAPLGLDDFAQAERL